MPINVVYEYFGEQVLSIVKRTQMSENTISIVVCIMLENGLFIIIARDNIDDDRLCHRCVLLPQLSDCKLDHADSDKVCHRCVVLPQLSDCKLDHADSNKLCHRYVWSC